MGIRDEKTRLTGRAVKRRSDDVSNAVTTPGTRAVRRTTRLDLLMERTRNVRIARSGGLRNVKGGQDDGWRVLDDGQQEFFRFSLAEESFLKALSRGVGVKKPYAIDVMEKQVRLGGLRLESVAGSGQLWDHRDRPVADFTLEEGHRVKVEVPGQRDPALLLIPTGELIHVRASGRSVARVSSMWADGSVASPQQFQVTFESSDDARERLWVVAALVLSDAWALLVQNRGRRPKT